MLATSETLAGAKEVNKFNYFIIFKKAYIYNMNYSLRELKEIIKEAWNMLTWDVDPVNTNISLSILKNCNAIRDTIDLVSKTNLFVEQITLLKSSVLFSTPGDEIKITKLQASEINSTLDILDDLLKGFYENLKLVLPDESPNSINIKLPPVNDFNDLSQYAKDFHLALTQVLYLEEINSQVKIESVENGSIWLNVLLEGSIASSIVGGLLWSGAVIYKKILEGRMMAQQLRALTIRTDSMDDVNKAQKESLELLIQSEAELINSENFKDNVPENIERIKTSIKLFANLLDKGAEIHPAIGAPEEVTNLYPNMKSLPTIESKVKQLNA